jgi:hypothetical protein
MNRSARPYRTLPGNVHRLPPPDANAVRRHWRELAEAALGLANSGVASDGRETSERLEFRHSLARAPAFPMPAGDAAAQAVVKAFAHAANAMLCAGTDERRAIIAPLLAAAAKAIESLLDEELAPWLALSRRISGDTEED